METIRRSDRGREVNDSVGCVGSFDCCQADRRIGKIKDKAWNSKWLVVYRWAAMRWVGFVYTEVYSLVGLALFATHDSPFSRKVGL